jgi:hypothetical protein
MMDPREDGVNGWIGLAQDRYKRRALVNVVMNSGSIKWWKLLA